VNSSEVVLQGRVQLRYEFEPTGRPDFTQTRGAPGGGQLFFDGRLVGSAEFDTTMPNVFGIKGLSSSYDFGEVLTHN